MIRHQSIEAMLAAYNDQAPLSEASTIPAPWYVDQRIAELESLTVFSHAWQVLGRADQVQKSGQFVTATVADEPVFAVRGADSQLRAFYNVCRHHAAKVVTEPCGSAAILHCPYHGWNYGLDGSLKGMPEFDGVKNFDRQENGLVRIKVEIWESFVFVNLDLNAEPLTTFLGGLVKRCQPLELAKLSFFGRKVYDIACNWKVFVDNYLDGGYHVPHLHKGLDRMLDYSEYQIEPGDRSCLQWSPLEGGGRALYYWIYPNFMINRYPDAMDTNLVVPLGIDQTEVIFDFYFNDISDGARERNLARIAVSESIQDEDVAICQSVQHGLSSRAYTAGRMSVRREAGEHLFHRLLYRDLKSGLGN